MSEIPADAQRSDDGNYWQIFGQAVSWRQQKQVVLMGDGTDEWPS